MKNKKALFSELLLILILLALVWEGFVLYNFYQNADEIECTWYYCKFTRTETIRISSIDAVRCIIQTDGQSYCSNSKNLTEIKENIIKLFEKNED